MSRGEQNENRFDPFDAEFVDRRLLLPTVGVIADIEKRAERMLKYAIPHHVIEHSFVVNGNPVLVKKHLEREQMNMGNEVEYPFGEIFFYDETCERMESKYRVDDDGFVYRTPGFLEGYDWQILENGTIGYFGDNWPRALEPEESDDLARRLFGFMDTPLTDWGSDTPLIVRAIKLASETGIKVIEREEQVPLRSDLDKGKPDQTTGDYIHIESFQRDGVQTGMETAVKLKIFIAKHNTRTVREDTTFTLFENGTAKYAFDPGDLSQVGKEANSNTNQNDLNERSKNVKWKNLTIQWELDRANQEHAERTRDLLKDAQRKIKRHVLRP